MKKKNARFLTMALSLGLFTGCGDTAATPSALSPSSDGESQVEKDSYLPFLQTLGFTQTEDGNIDWTVDLSLFDKGGINAKVAVHDPSLYIENGTYYIFGSHMSSASSSDARNFSYIGTNGYSSENSVYGDLFAENSHVFDYAGSKDSVIPTDDGTYHVWAPDVIYNDTMGCYMLYYCTSSTWNASNLCFATSDSLEGPYTWQGALVYSGFTKDTISATDVLSYVSEDYAQENYYKANGEYNYDDCPNAIDPTIFYDEDHKLWMVYGSWSGGIFLLEIDPETGYPIRPDETTLASDENYDPYFGKRLLGGGHKSIEGPYILYDAESKYYYLFVSYGSLNRDGGYQIRVFRSKTVDGEYEDMNGARPDKNSVHATFGLKLSGNYILPSMSYGYKATGHNSAAITDDGIRLLAYHTRFDGVSEDHQPRIKQFLINKEGWPCLLPYEYNYETVSKTGYSKEEIVGKYYFINQGIMIDSTVSTPEYMVLCEDGTILGDGIDGNYTYEEGSYYIELTYKDTKKDSHTYSGVLCKQTDLAGKEVLTFSAVGMNKSLWGVKYLE